MAPRKVDCFLACRTGDLRTKVVGSGQIFDGSEPNFLCHVNALLATLYYSTIHEGANQSQHSIQITCTQL